MCTGTYPDANSPLDSLRGLPPSMVMMVAISSSAASTSSYHLHSEAMQHQQKVISFTVVIEHGSPSFVVGIKVAVPQSLLE